MEIQLPEIQSYLDNIKNGSITEIRLPRMEIKTGEVLTAFSSFGNGGAIHLKVLASETVPLESITAEEAEQEGFAALVFARPNSSAGTSNPAWALKTMRSLTKTASLWRGPRKTGNCICGRKYGGSARPVLPERRRKTYF
jgi:hypothetical protein